MMSPAQPNPEGLLITDSMVANEFERAVFRFEREWQVTRPFQEQLPRTLSAELVGELACIDLEFRWRAGQEPELADYLEVGRRLGLAPTQFNEILFEDYRLRSRYGQPRAKEEYAAQYQLDVSAWPTWDRTESGPERNAAVRQASARQLPQLGTDLHGYSLVGILGQGAYGCVYLARQAGLANRLVVLKVTPPSEHEPQLLAELQHTHIVPIYSLHRDQEWQSICMPFLGLVTLAELRPRTHGLSSNGQALLSTVAARKIDTLVASTREAGTDGVEVDSLLQPERFSRLPAIRGLDCQRTLLWMFARVAEALNFAHERGVVHGDVKPANILIADDGAPLLLDFHLAFKSREGAAGPEYVGGTLPYMSPDQLRAMESGAAIDPSTDLFALGVVMYELLGGRLPFPTRGSDSASLASMAQEREQAPLPLRKVNPQISADVETMVMQCLAPASGERYASLGELQEDLERHLAHRPLKHAPNRSLRERGAKWTRRHPVLASTWTLTALFLAVIGLSAWLVTGRLELAKQLEANESSRHFVHSLQKAVLPLTVPGIDRHSSQKAQQELLGLLQAHYGGTERGQFSRLSPDQQAAELGQISAAAFWWARSALAESRAHTTMAARKPSLLALSQQAEELAGKLPAAAAAPFKQVKQSLDLLVTSENLTADDLQQPLTNSSMPQPNSPESLLIEAAKSLEAGQPLVALEQLEQTLSRDANNFQAWLLKGHAWLAAGNRERASEAYGFCVALQPDSPWGWFQRGVVRFEQGDIAGSRSDFNRCVELEPKEPAAWLNRALAARALGDFPAALADLNQAIELGCSQTRAWYLRHQLHRQLGDNQAAAADLREFLEREPTDAKSWLTRGLARAQANQPEAALADFEAGLQLAPDSPDAWQNIATVQSEMLGQTEEGVKALTQIVALRPNDPIPLVTRGVLQGRMERRSEAVADAQAAVRLRSDAEILFRAAGVYALTSASEPNDFQTAIDLLRAAALRDPRLVLSRVEADSDLESLRQHPDYQQLLATLRDLARSPASSTEVQQ